MWDCRNGELGKRRPRGPATGNDGRPAAPRPGRLRLAQLAHRRTRAGSRVTLRALDGIRAPVSRAVVVALVRDGARVTRVRAVTGARGRAHLRLRFDGCVTLRVTKASAAGFRWDGRAPRRRLCA